MVSIITIEADLLTDITSLAQRLITQIRGRRKTNPMTSAIEDTVKALVEFESELDKARAEITEAKRRAMRDATEWAEAARASAVSKAQEIASQRVAKAREEAEAEAERIRKKGDSDLKAFESSISGRRGQAAQLVASRLLGEQK